MLKGSFQNDGSGLTARIPLRRLWPPAAIIVLIVLAAILALTFIVQVPEELDRETWKSMQRHFDPAAVTKVELTGPAGLRATLAGPEAQSFSRALFAATFVESNAQHFGPTAEIVVVYTFPGEETFTPNQWPDGRFEVSWGGRQFLVSSPELARLLEEKGYVYRER
ncbi:MAG: hypothetical protein MUQ56_11425 [Thermoleophilia bacterium]|nr:hypothetical protein [Thermoleophilia bacterium]